MQPEKKKPVAREHRPIALTNVGYKLFMGIMKNRMWNTWVGYVMVDIYSGDRTEKWRNGEVLGETGVTSGIRQG